MSCWIEAISVASLQATQVYLYVMGFHTDVCFALWPHVYIRQKTGADSGGAVTSAFAE